MDDRTILERALRKSTALVGCIGAGTIGLGVFMILLHAADLDPDTRRMATVELVGLYFFGILFAVVGLSMLYVALVKAPAQGRELLRLLDTDPGAIERVESFVIKTEGYESAPGGQHGVRFFLRGGQMRQVMTKQDSIEPILRYVASRAPHARRTA